MWLLGRCASVLLGLCATVALWQVVAHCTVIELVMSGLKKKKEKHYAQTLILVNSRLAKLFISCLVIFGAMKELRGDVVAG